MYDNVFLILDNFAGVKLVLLRHDIVERQHVIRVHVRCQQVDRGS